MIDLKSTTFMIPVKIDSPKRAENLFIIMSYLLSNFNTNIIINEQSNNGRFFVKDILPDNFNYLYLQFESQYPNSIHRTKQLNEMLSIADTPVVVNYDCDVLMYPSQYTESSNKILFEDYDVVYPYDRHFYNVPPEYHQSIYNRSIELNNIKNLEIIPIAEGCSVGGCMFLKRESYIKSGGENEWFIGWGPEDKERFERFKLLDYKIERIDGDIYHLKHPPSSWTNPYWQQNEKLWKDINRGLNKNTIEQYINKFEWRIK